MRKYVFADEAGNFDFRDKSGASQFFILTTVTADSPDVGDDLLTLRRDLTWDGIALESKPVTFETEKPPLTLENAEWGTTAFWSGVQLLTV